MLVQKKRKISAHGKKIISVFILLFIFIIAITIFAIFKLDQGLADRLKRGDAAGASFEVSFVKLPPGFSITIFAKDIGGSLLGYPGPNAGPRFFEWVHDTLFVSVPNKGVVLALPDMDHDGKADEKRIVIDGLNRPHGLTQYNNWFYIAEENQVVRVKLKTDLVARKDTLEVVVPDLPTGGHWTRTIRIKDDQMYVSIGSSCNNCLEPDERRGAVLICELPPNQGCEIFAHGSRNAVGIAFHPKTGELFATENARDLLGNDLPPDEINILQQGKKYGWPHCYGKQVPDPDYGDAAYCKTTEPSALDIQAHSAPLGLAFNPGGNFPAEYTGDLFVAYHGSWNREEKTGYKVVRVRMKDPVPASVEDFATGWLAAGDTVLGRPVDITFDKQGRMYVSDDKEGVIYRIQYQGIEAAS